MNEQRVRRHRVQWEGFQHAAFKFDRLAISGRGELLLVSLVAPTQNIKQIRAILDGGAKAVCMAGGVKVNQPSREPWYEHSPGRLFPTPDGYQCYAQARLRPGPRPVPHRMPGFMKVVTPESLWQELNDVAVHHADSQDWIPYIEEQLRRGRPARRRPRLQLPLRRAVRQTKHLDEIVSRGSPRRHDQHPCAALA